MAGSRVRASSSSPAGGRAFLFLSLSFFPLEAEKRRGGGGGIKKNDALAARHTNERTKFPECKRGTARSACALADCSAPRIDLSIVFERRRPRLPQTFVYKCEYRSSYRRLERLNAPHSTLHYARLFSLPLPPPRLIPLLDSCLFRANSNVGFQFRRRSFAQRFEMERLWFTSGFVGNTRGYRRLKKKSILQKRSALRIVYY